MKEEEEEGKEEKDNFRVYNLSVIQSNGNIDNVGARVSVRERRILYLELRAGEFWRQDEVRKAAAVGVGGASGENVDWRRWPARTPSMPKIGSDSATAYPDWKAASGAEVCRPCWPGRKERAEQTNRHRIQTTAIQNNQNQSN